MQRQLPEAEQRDQDEDHLAGVHVAEQSQRQGERLGQQTHHFHEQVDGNEDPVVERVQEEFLEIPCPLHLEPVVDHQDEHPQGQTDGDVEVRGGDDLLVVNPDEREQPGNEIHGNQIHEIHQKHPDQYRQGEGTDQRVVTVKAVLDGTLDKFHHPLDEILQPAGDAGGGALGRGTEKQDENQPETDGPTHGIHVDGPESHLLSFGGRMGETPAAVRMLAEYQVLQVVLDIFVGSLVFACHRSESLSRLLCACGRSAAAL